MMEGEKRAPGRGRIGKLDVSFCFRKKEGGIDGRSLSAARSFVLLPSSLSISLFLCESLE